MQHSRRQFIHQSSGALASFGLSSLLHADTMKTAGPQTILCVGGHPDDPESGCGGSLAKLAAAGHDVRILYLTTGEAGIPGKSPSEAAAIRKQEAVNACSILKATPIFAGQIDGSTIFNNEWQGKVQKLIEEQRPRVVFTHWPVDTHKDHQVASLLTIQSWIRTGQKFALYFFEVCAGEQTLLFHPTDYIDITETQQQKRKALFMHVSQDPESIYACGHAAMEDFRGRELGVRAAEGFVRMTGRGMGALTMP